MAEIRLNFIFCEICSNVINGNGFQPLGFNGWHYCSEVCWNNRDKKMQVLFAPWFNDKSRLKFESCNLERLEEVYKRIIKSSTNRIQKEVSNELEKLEGIKKEILSLEREEIKIREELNEYKIKRVILSHPNKCQRCLRIDSRGDYFNVGPEDCQTNKIFLCHKCYPIVNIYVDDLFQIYRDWEIVKKFVILEESFLDKVFGVKVQGGY